MTGRLSVLRSEVTLENMIMSFFTWKVGLPVPRRFGSVDVCSISDLPTHPRLLILVQSHWTRLGATCLYTVSDACAVQGVCHGCQACGGVGNIYACEALFMAGVKSKTRASRPVKFVVKRLPMRFVRS